MLKIIFKKAYKYNPCFNIKKVSYPKVEKVLKPPQNPVKINSFKAVADSLLPVFKTALLLIAHMVTANSRQASTFETKVPIGKELIIFNVPKPIMYLSTQPTPPPINTNKKFISKILLNSQIYAF